jgi:hypothetical protein
MTKTTPDLDRDTAYTVITTNMPGWIGGAWHIHINHRHFIVFPTGEETMALPADVHGTVRGLDPVVVPGDDYEGCIAALLRKLAGAA